MFQIIVDDMGYALRELKKPPQLNYEWEAALRENSRDFWKFLTDKVVLAGKIKVGNLDLEIDHESPTVEVRKAAAETRKLRNVLNFVFAAVYSACGRMLPRLYEKEALAALESFRALQSSEDVLLRMSVINPIWSMEFEQAVDECNFHGFSRSVLFALVKTLLNELPDERLSDQIEGLSPSMEKDLKKISEIVDQVNSLTEKVKLKSARPAEIQDSSKITFDEIGGQERAKNEVKKLAAALKNPERYKKWGTKPPRGICLVGPPGNGKTLLARALATETNVPFYNVNSSDLITAWYGQSSKNVDAVFKKVQKSGGIIFFDEADAIASSRDHRDAHEESKRIVAALCRNMDGFNISDRVVVFFATNRLEDMDKAVLRPGRTDRIIEVPLPDKEGRRQVFHIHIKQAEKNAESHLFEELDIETILDKTKDFSGSDIAEIIRRTLEEKVQEEDKGNKPGLVTDHDILSEIESYERVEKSRKEIGFKAP